MQEANQLNEVTVNAHLGFHHDPGAEDDTASQIVADRGSVLVTVDRIIDQLSLNEVPLLDQRIRFRQTTGIMRSAYRWNSSKIRI